MGLIDDLAAGPVAVDTALFIYLIEEHPGYLAAVQPLFASAVRGERTLVTSAVTLLEVLAVPYRAGNLPLAARYEALLANSRGVRMVDLDRGQLRAAAQLRAAYRVRTPDALQLAAALTERCSALVTNDRAFPQVSGLEVIQLSDYL